MHSSGSVNDRSDSLKPNNSPKVQNGEVKLSPSIPKDLKKDTIPSAHESFEELIPELKNVKVSSKVIDSLDILQEDITELQEDVQLVRQESLAASVISKTRTNLNEILEKPEALEQVIQDAQGNKMLHEAILAPLETVLKMQVDAAQEYLAESMEYIDPILSLSEHVQNSCDKVIEGILMAELAVKLPSQIFSGGLLIQRKVILERAKNLLSQVNENKIPNFTNVKKSKLELFIRQQSSVVNEGASNLAVEFLSYIPKATQTIIKAISHVSSSSPALVGIGMSNALTWMATSAYDLYKSVKAKALFTKFKSDQKDPINAPTPSPFVLRKILENSENKSMVHSKFEKFLEPLNPNDKEIHAKFQEAGINLEKARDFVKYLKDVPAPFESKELELFSAEFYSEYLNDNYSKYSKLIENNLKPVKKITSVELTQLWNDSGFKYALEAQFSQNQTLTYLPMQQLLNKRLKAHEDYRALAAEGFYKNIDAFLQVDGLEMGTVKPFSKALELLISNHVDISKMQKFNKFIESLPLKTIKLEEFKKGVALLKEDLSDLFFKSKGFDLLKAKRFSEFVEKQSAPVDPTEKTDFLFKALRIFRKEENRENQTTGLDKSLSEDQFQQLLTNDAFRFSLLDQFSEYKQTMTAETRLALKSLSEKKLESERKFFNFKVGSAATYFSMSTLAAAASITLKVLAVAGVIAATSAALALPGLGLLVGGAIIVSVGLLFLYKYKPNLFEGILKGTAVKLAFQEIPMAIYNFRLHKAKSIQDKKTAYVNFLSARISEIDQLDLAKDAQSGSMSSDLASLLDLLKESAEKDSLGMKNGSQEFESLRTILKQEHEIFESKKLESDRQVKIIEETVEKYKKNADALKADLADRGTQDFLVAAGYYSNDVKGKNRLINASERIAMSLLEGNFDDETKNIFHHRMGIDLDKLALEHAKDSNLKDAMKKAMNTYFGMGRDELEKFMKKIQLEGISPAA